MAEPLIHAENPYTFANPFANPQGRLRMRTLCGADEQLNVVRNKPEAVTCPECKRVLAALDREKQSLVQGIKSGDLQVLDEPIKGIGVLRCPVGHSQQARAMVAHLGPGSILILPNTRDHHGEYEWDFRIEGGPMSQAEVRRQPETTEAYGPDGKLVASQISATSSCTCGAARGMFHAKGCPVPSPKPYEHPQVAIAKALPCPECGERVTDEHPWFILYADGRQRVVHDGACRIKATEKSSEAIHAAMDEANKADAPTESWRDKEPML